MRAKVNLSFDPDVVSEARALGLNMSRLAEDAVARAVKVERNRKWVEENHEALDAYSREIERDGLPLARHRQF